MKAIVNIGITTHTPPLLANEACGPGRQVDTYREVELDLVLHTGSLESLSHHNQRHLTWPASTTRCQGPLLPWAIIRHVRTFCNKLSLYHEKKMMLIHPQSALTSNVCLRFTLVHHNQTITHLMMNYNMPGVCLQSHSQIKCSHRGRTI